MEDVYTLCSAAWIYFTEGRENRDVSPQGMIAEKRKQFSRAVDFYVRALTIDSSCAVATQGLAIISAEDVPLGSAIRPGTESHRRTQAASEALDILLDNGYIALTSEDGMWYKAVDPKGKQPVYAVLDD